MDAAFAKMQFKSLMVQIRFLSENADADLAQTMHRELEREIGVLIPKFRFSRSPRGLDMVETEEPVIHSRPTG